MGTSHVTITAQQSPECLRILPWSSERALFMCNPLLFAIILMRFPFITFHSNTDTIADGQCRWKQILSDASGINQEWTLSNIF